MNKLIMNFFVWSVILVLGGLFLNVSCNRGDTTFYRIPVYEGLESSSFSDVKNDADSICYISLETTDSCLIGQVYKIVRWADFYYISDLSQNLYLFTDSGKFVRRIGRQGKGPEEYTNLCDFAVDHENGDVFLVDYGKVLVYNTEGEFQRSFTVESDMQVCTMDKAGHLVFIAPSPMESGCFDLLTLCDKNGVVISRIPGVGEDCDLSYFNWITEHRDRIYYKPEFSDTLYFLDATQKVHPCAQVDFGEYKLTPASLKIDKINELSEYDRLDGVFDFEKFIILNVQKGLKKKELEAFIFDKDTGTIKKWKLEGMKIGITSVYGNQLVCSLSAMDLLDCQEIRSTGLKKVVSQIQADSNPVLAVVYLK